MAPSSRVADLWTGRLVGGRWRIRSLLDDSGGMASVYLADDERLPRKAVVKIPKAAQFNAEFAERFAREANWHAKVSDRNVVHILDRGEEEGVPFLVLQYLPGGNLKAWCERSPSILSDPWLHYDSWLLPIAQALDAVAAQEIVHRDVKPSNILFDAAGQAYLSDFGIVKAGGDATMTGTGMFIGTLQFMSPEQCDDGTAGSVRDLDGRSDQYGLAVTAYQVLTGWKYPVDGDTIVPIVKAKLGLAPLLPPREHDPRIPQAVNDTVMRALATDREGRFASSVEFAKALLAGFVGPHAVSPGSMSATGSSPVSPSGPVRKRGGIKRPLEVFVIGWLIALGNVFLLLTSVLQIGTLQLDAAMAASPLPQPLLFGGAIVNTICGIGILYGEQLARIGSCALGIVGLIVTAATVRSPEILLGSVIGFSFAVTLLFTPRSNRYFSGRIAGDSSAAPPIDRYVQVVGRDCASCDQRISDATTADPCSGCSRPLHLGCTAVAGGHLCPACASGLPNPAFPGQAVR